MKMHLRLLALAAMIGLAWSLLVPVAAADPPAKTAIAIVGAAHTHMKWYPGTLNGNANVRIKYLWAPDPKRAEWCVKQFHGTKVVANVNQIFADPEVTGVVICSETNRHHNLVIAAANAHKAMFVEKPLAITAKEAAQMADAIDKAGVFFTTGYFMRDLAEVPVRQGADRQGQLRQDYAGVCRQLPQRRPRG